MPTESEPAPIAQIVNICVDGILNMIMGESTGDRSKEMNEHHDRLLKIVEENRIPDAPRYATPREQITAETREANDHVRMALSELEKAQKLSKCGVCKATLADTINIVSDKTQEILETSEKLLAIQRMKDMGELPPDAKWETLNKNQKKQVDHIVEKFRPPVPILESDYFKGVGDENGTKTKRTARKPAQKRKPKSRR
jgi:hypothetical protein